ncbi:MAG: hypothetical protein IKU10_04870 [Clostridia bacterium]|nr:hypothetical protein [Clostridia bacterium]
MKICKQALSFVLVVALLVGLLSVASVQAATAFTANTDVSSSLTHLALDGATGDANYSNFRKIAQKFVPSETNLSGVKLGLNLTAGTATVHLELRSSLTGTAIASANTDITSKGNGMYWYDATLGQNVTLTAGTAYYFVYWLTARTSSSVCVVGGKLTSSVSENPAYFWKVSTDASPNYVAQGCVVGFELITANYVAEPFESYTSVSQTISHLALHGATSSDSNYSNYAYIGQEFVPSTSHVAGAKVALNLTQGKATAKVEIRSTVNGSALASNTVALTSQGNGKYWYTLNLGKTLTVTPKQTYYLVYYLTARDSGSLCVVYGADVGAGNAMHPGYSMKLKSGGPNDLAVGSKNVIYGFEMLTDDDFAGPVTDQIAALPSTITLSHKSKVTAARSAYNALTSTQKALVTNLSKLTAAESTIAQLEQAEADEEAAQAVIDKIAALPSTITLSHKSKVTAARSAYNALTSTQKSLVTNLSKLTSAETKIKNLEAAQVVIDQINALPTTITLDAKSAVTAARSAYSALTSTQQGMVTNLSTLTAAETKIKNLEAAKTVTDLIAALPSTITLSHKSKVTAARTAYEALTDTQKGMVTNLNKLVTAEAIINSLEEDSLNEAAAKKVQDLIAALPSTVTLSHESQVTAARYAYNGLTDTQRSLVTNLSKLTTAETRIKNLKAAQAVIDQIAALPSTIKLTNKSAVEAARAAYNALTSTQKGMVTNLSKLTAAESTIAQLEQAEIDKAVAQTVIDQIAALPSTITLSHKSTVEAARKAYNGLTSAQQGYVTNLSKLTSAESKIASLEKVEADKAAAKIVQDQIAALPSTLTVANQAAVQAARTAYNGLTSAQKEYVTNLSKLTAAETTMSNLTTAQTVIDKIANLPLNITLSDESTVSSVRSAYNALTSTQKGYVTNLSKLTAAETTIANLKAAKAVDDKIAALPSKITLSHQSAVEAARKAYTDLTADQKDLVTKLDKLVAAERTIMDCQIAQVTIDTINALPSPITYIDEWDVIAARDLYESLTDAQKALVTNLSKLTAAEKVIADYKAADAIIIQLYSLPYPLTLADEGTVVSIRKAYSALTDGQKALVENYSLLTEAEAEIARLKEQASQGAADQAAAQGVIDQIGALNVEGLDDESAVIAAREAYKALTDTQKGLVTNLAKLQQAEGKIAELKAAAEQEAADKAAAQVVIDQIETLNVEGLDDESVVIAARETYEALTDTQKGLVTNLAKLQQAEGKIAELKAQAEQEAADKAAAQVVIDQIEVLNVQTLDDQGAVEAAREAYGALTDTQKALVTNLDQLSAAEQAIEALKNPPVTILCGDVDGDGKVTAADALEVLKSVVGKTILDENQFKAADTDGSGKADAADALNILKKVVGKLQIFPVEEE